MQCPLGARAMGIRDRPIAARSPWQNGYAERVIGSIRRECLDHIIVTGEQQLRRIMQSYIGYYDRARTHLALSKDAPCTRRIERHGGHPSSPRSGWSAPPIWSNLVFGRDRETYHAHAVLVE